MIILLTSTEIGEKKILILQLVQGFNKHNHIIKKLFGFIDLRTRESKERKRRKGFGRLPSFFFPPFLFVLTKFFPLVILVQIWLCFCYYEG